MKEQITPAGQYKAELEDIEDYNNPIVEIGVGNVDYLISEIFLQTEILGLPERQLGAYKKIVRRQFWSWFNGNLPNPHNLADPSSQARQYHGIEDRKQN